MHLLKATSDSVTHDSSSTTKIIASTSTSKPTTISRATTTPAATTSATTTPTSTTIPTTTPTISDSDRCWKQHNYSSPDVCHACNICRHELTSGGIAGIVIAVIIIYALSLISTALLVSYYTKKGILDFDKMIFSRITIWKKKKDEVQMSSSQTDGNDYCDDQQTDADAYTVLRIPSSTQSPSDDPTYTALVDTNRGSRKLAHSEKQAKNGPVPKAQAELQMDAEAQIPGTPKSKNRKRDKTGDVLEMSGTGPNRSTPKKKPTIMEKPPKTKIIEEDIYQN